jgi:hypothetical protein
MTSIRKRPPSPTIPIAAIFRAVAIAGVAAAMVPAAMAQEPIAFAQPDPELFPPNTLVARYRIDPAVLEGVTTSEELVAVLREHLMVEASMPLDEPLLVHLAGNVHSPRASNAYHVQSGRFGFALAAGAAVSSDLASVVRASQEAETFSDWDEEEAWAWLLQGLEDALAKETSVVAQASGPRARNEAGRVPLRIAAVHSVRDGDEAWELQDSFERDYIELRPSADFGSSSLAGWEPPEGFTYDVQLLYLELEPAAEAERVAQEEPIAIELSSEALDRFVGNYEMQPGVIIEVWREGEVLMAAPSADKTNVATLRPFSETEFWTDVGGDRTIIRFSIGLDGAVKSMTMEQGAFNRTLLRVP